jgi:hypothetical protein
MEMNTYRLIAFLLIAGVFVSCKKTHVQPKQSTPDLSIHTGHGHIRQDFGMCAICGGYDIVFDNDTSAMYRSHQSLDNFGITSNSKFPVEATISWKLDTAINSPDFITITSVKTDQ